MSAHERSVHEASGREGSPLLELRDVRKSFRAGSEDLHVLRSVSLTICAGEFVAIMGPSGSGKSTLMNIIGCLDQPTAGDYRVRGRSVLPLSSDELAELRRDTFGFVFQRYNLLGTASAEENIEIPAIYSGRNRKARRLQALELLQQMKLADKAEVRPAQLSGGQQQRVAIARALMNNPPIILADEPTGALDTQNGQDVMQMLADLNAQGRTVILITHDEQVAAHARRQIRLRDGVILSDSGADFGETTEPFENVTHTAVFPAFGESARMAWRSLHANLFRTALTLLGIIIGVAAVITMSAVGAGSKQRVVDQISSMGTNLVSIRPGAPGLRGSGDIITLTPADASVIASLPNVDAVLPERSGRYTLRVGSIDYQSIVTGVSADLPWVRDWPLASGSFFTESDFNSYAPVIVLGQTVVKNLFPDGSDPIGRFILVKNIPFRVIGTLGAKGASWFGDQDDAAFVPLSTGLIRLYGKSYLNAVTVKVTDLAGIAATTEQITELLKQRHHTEDFSIRDMASLIEMASSTQDTLTLLLGVVAAISLLVGGIGVMNIMLVSVTERTREIGIRMATGARARDILTQFTTEAAVVCVIGGFIGVAMGLATGIVLALFEVPVVFSVTPPVIAFMSAFLTGIVFGFLPARKASRLNTVVALAAE